MNKKALKANVLLLLTSMIWGFAFIAQRVGIKYVGSLTFNGIRFALGSISLIPLVLFSEYKAKNGGSINFKSEDSKPFEVIKAGTIIGLMLFAGVTLQQLGLKETTAGKAAFITGFYLILVPLFGIFFKQKINASTWIAGVVSLAGLYLISINEDFSIARGDLLVFLGSFFWAGHILFIDRFNRKYEPLKLSLVQYIFCSLLSLILALVFEDITIDGIVQAAVPILYGGIASVGIAYTLQIYGQKYARPSHAAILLSLESVFAAIGEFLILGETMSLRAYTGCLLMFAGVISSQLGSINGYHTKATKPL
ncbi:MAG: DMT family transporter [Clostridiales bacterium]|nr:DMT family transporter [Clostridiales bacterium]